MGFCQVHIKVALSQTEADQRTATPFWNVPILNPWESWIIQIHGQTTCDSPMTTAVGCDPCLMSQDVGVSVCLCPCLCPCVWRCRCVCVCMRKRACVRVCISVFGRERRVGCTWQPPLLRWIIILSPSKKNKTKKKNTHTKTQRNRKNIEQWVTLNAVLQKQVSVLCLYRHSTCHTPLGLYSLYCMSCQPFHLSYPPRPTLYHHGSSLVKHVQAKKEKWITNRDQGLIGSSL